MTDKTEFTRLGSDNFKRYLPILTLAGVMTLTGCSGSGSSSSSTDSNESEETEELFSSTTIDATSYTDWAYFSLTSGTTVAESEEWHLAFKRYEVRTNTDLVKIALADEQAEFYDAGGDPIANVLMNVDADTEEDHLLATYDLSTMTLETDEINPAINREGSGAVFGDLVPNVEVADPDTWLLLKSAEGDSYAKVHFTSYIYNMDTSATPPLHQLVINAEFYVQASGTNVFNSVPVTWSRDETTENCFDFDSGSVVGCDTDTWDIQYTRDGMIINGGFSGSGSAGVYMYDADNNVYGMTQAQVDAITDASAFVSFEFTNDKASKFFYDNDWYAYNLADRHGIWPNYRVYVIDTDGSDDTAPKYKLQVTNYYNESDVSGHISIRYLAIEE